MSEVIIDLVTLVFSHLINIWLLLLHSGP